MNLSLNFKLGIVLLIPLFLFSCKRENEQIVDEDLLRTIATDQVYINYQEKEEQHQINIGTGFYDMEALSAYFSNKIDNNYDICTTKDTKLTQIRGGEDYINMECEIHRLRGEVMKEYPNVSFDKETIMQVYFTYRQINNEYPASNHLINELNQTNQ